MVSWKSHVLIICKELGFWDWGASLGLTAAAGRWAGAGGSNALPTQQCCRATEQSLAAGVGLTLCSKTFSLHVSDHLCSAEGQDSWVNQSVRSVLNVWCCPVSLVFRRPGECFPDGLCLCHCVWSCCSHPLWCCWPQSGRSIPTPGFPVFAAGEAPIPAGSQYRHNSSAVCLTSFTGANQCLPSPDRRLLSLQALSAYVSVKYRAVISVLPRLGVFAPA